MWLLCLHAFRIRHNNHSRPARDARTCQFECLSKGHSLSVHLLELWMSCKTHWSEPNAPIEIWMQAYSNFLRSAYRYKLVSTEVTCYSPRGNHTPNQLRSIWSRRSRPRLLATYPTLIKVQLVRIDLQPLLNGFVIFPSELSTNCILHTAPAGLGSTIKTVLQRKRARAGMVFCE
jgi:hypothetical protein